MDKPAAKRRIYDQFNENDEQYAANYPLSKQILDYYYKFGQERNLERYLKLNRSLGGSKSSSDGSLDQNHRSNHSRSVHFAPGPSRERAKSMECLERGYKDDKFLQTESTSYQSCVDQIDTGDECLEQSSSSEMIVGSHNQVQESKEKRRVKVHKENRDGKKSYQINVESKVEIAFPTQFYQAMTAGMMTAPEIPSNKSVAEVVESKDEVEEPPIEVSLNVTNNNINNQVASNNKTINQSTISEFQPVSPASSIASTKQRLEWDSLGDVGYQRSQSVDCVRLLNRKTNSLTLVQSPAKATMITSAKSTGAIPKRKKEIPSVKQTAPEQPPMPAPPEKDSTPINKSKSADKWKELLRRVKDKSNSIILEPSHGDHLETPSSKITFDSNSSKFAQSTPVVSPVMEEVVKEDHKCVEKSCQTTDHQISTVSRSIQAIYEHLDKTTSMSSNHEESTAGSFEFIKGSQVVDRGCSARSIEKSSSSSVVSSTTASSLFTAPPTVEERKMNTLKVKREISVFLSNVTGKDPAGEQDMQKAVEYIAMLYDSKSIDKKLKRKFLEKIIAKLLRKTENKKEKPIKAPVNNQIDSNRDTIKETSEKIQQTNKSSIEQAKVKETERSFKSGQSTIDSTNLSDIKQSDLLKDWLKPMTNSEIEYERQKGGSRRRKSDSEASLDHTRKSSLSTESMDNKDKEKNLQLKCIEREIEYLERIKQLIKVGRMNLMDDTDKNLMALQGRDKLPSESRSSTAEEVLSMSSSRTRCSVTTNRDSKASISDWDSHKNLQIVIKDRRKLKTPSDHHHNERGSHEPDGEDLKEFVDRRTKEFAEKYDKRTRLYTDPSKHYSEPRSSSNLHHPHMINASTSVNSCEFSCTGPEFVQTASTIESSASKMAAIKKTKPTMNCQSAQTGFSLSFSAPIVSSRNPSRQSAKSTSRDKRIVPVTATSSCPKSIAYTIVLNPKETSSACTEITTTSTALTNASSTDLLYEKVKGAPDTARLRICETGRFCLEDFLKINRPDFIEHAGERMVEVETARRRRVQKNQEKENLLMSPNLPRSKISKLLEESVKGEQENFCYLIFKLLKSTLIPF